MRATEDPFVTARHAANTPMKQLSNVRASERSLRAMQSAMPSRTRGAA